MWSQRLDVPTSRPSLSTPNVEQAASSAASAVRPSDVFFREDQQFNTKDPRSIVAYDVEIAGWLVNKPGFNCPGERTCEDVHYNLEPDPDYIAANTQKSSLWSWRHLPGNAPGLIEAPTGLSLRGQLTPVTDVDENGRSRGITVNSFLFPGSGQDQMPNTNIGSVSFGRIESCRSSGQSDNCLLQPIAAIHIELNAFNVANDYSKDHGLDGRPGTPPQGWISVAPYTNSYWPYSPLNPDGMGELNAGDYVIVRGTLWEDVSHVQGPCVTTGGITCSPTKDAPDKWQQAAWVWATNRQHGGWLEIHPPDSIRRAAPPARRKEVYAISAAAMGSFFVPDQEVAEAIIKPRFRSGPNDQPVLEELIDGRFTDMSSVKEHLIAPLTDGSYYVRARVQSPAIGFGSFKAAYVLSYKTGPALPVAPPTAFVGYWHRIASRQSGQILDVNGNSCDDGTQIIQWPRNSGLSQNQLWAFISAGDGSWYIINQRSGRVLDINQASTAPGARLIQFPLNYGTNQRFRIDAVGGGYVRITAAHSGQVLDVEGASLSNGTRIIQWPWNGDPNQQWQLQVVGESINWRALGSSCF